MSHKFQVGDNVLAYVDNRSWKPYMVTAVIPNVTSPSYVLTSEDGTVILKYEGLMKREEELSDEEQHIV